MKKLIPDRQKAYIRKQLENEMDTACVIYKAGAATSDGMGGYTNATKVEVETTVCFIGELGTSAQEREIANQNQEYVVSTIRLPYDADINKNCWITADGVDYHVLGFVDSDIDVYKKVVAGVRR